MPKNVKFYRITFSLVLGEKEKNFLLNFKNELIKSVEEESGVNYWKPDLICETLRCKLVCGAYETEKVSQNLTILVNKYNMFRNGEQNEVVDLWFYLQQCVRLQYVWNVTCDFKPLGAMTL